MRDLNKLYDFYYTLMKIHMENFPDWRFGQLIENFEGWIRDNTENGDIFYIEEDIMLKYLQEFLDSIKVY